MKRVLIILILAGFTSISLAQEGYDKSIFEAKEITFYGYDFSHFKLEDIKKYGKTKEDKSTLVDGWTAWLDKYISKSLLEKRMERTVGINNSVTSAINKSVVPGDNLVEERFYLNKEEIPGWIKAYELSETEGIGMVVIIECFSRSKDKVSMYVVYFNISSRDILASIPFETKEADGGGLVEFWGRGTEFNTKIYLSDGYGKALKAYNKSLK